MRVYGHDNATERRLVTRGISRDRLGLELITGSLLPGSVFVDVGASCGLYTLHAARRIGSQGRVLAFEPKPTMVERLRFNIAANGFGNVDIIEALSVPQERSAAFRSWNARRGQGPSMSPLRRSPT